MATWPQVKRETTATLARVAGIPRDHTLDQVEAAIDCLVALVATWRAYRTSQVPNYSPHDRDPELPL